MGPGHGFPPGFLSPDVAAFVLIPPRLSCHCCVCPVGTVDNSPGIHSWDCVFSTKGRRPALSSELRDRLWPYLGGIARENRMKLLNVGGTSDHVHLLLSLPTTMAIVKGLQLIKGGSSKWISDTFSHQRDFEWQEGYGAFSISILHADDTAAYIARQEEHHRRKTFQEEYVEFLKKHGIEYDERHLWN